MQKSSVLGQMSEFLIPVIKECGVNFEGKLQVFSVNIKVGAKMSILCEKN